MRDIVIFAAAGVGLFLLAVVGVRAWSASRTRVVPGPPARRPEPDSVVHVLAGDGELRAAIERASRFERDVAELLESRAARYESLLVRPAGSAVPELRSVREPAPGTVRRTRPA